MWPCFCADFQSFVIFSFLYLTFHLNRNVKRLNWKNESFRVKIRVCFNASFVPILWTKCDACWSLSVGHDHFIVNFLPYNGAELIFILNLGSWPFYICQSSLEYLIKGILNSEGVGIWTSFPLFDEKVFSDGKSHILNWPF